MERWDDYWTRIIINSMVIGGNGEFILGSLFCFGKAGFFFVFFFWYLDCVFADGIPFLFWMLEVELN